LKRFPPNSEKTSRAPAAGNSRIIDEFTRGEFKSDESRADICSEKTFALNRPRRVSEESRSAAPDLRLKPSHAFRHFKHSVLR
jgi:hypothetical protein